MDPAPENVDSPLSRIRWEEIRKEIQESRPVER